MLTATQSHSILGTQQYFDSVLTRGDYYSGQEIAGQWHGKGADVLGVGEGAKVTREAFHHLLEGRHPTSGKQLAQRLRQDRRPGMDFTFSVPKSVSLVWAILEDERVIESLKQAVHETMCRDIEPLMHRRVRDGKRATTKERTATSNLIYADFLHKTSRPVEGLADPHLHIHAFVINWTEEGGKHYAGEFEEIVRQRASLQAKFEARLAQKLQHLGYAVEHTHFLQSGRFKRGWEIAGLSRAVIEKFSRRTAQVEQVAAERGIVDAAKKGQLGKLTREKKDDGQSIAQLRHAWDRRLTREERAMFARLTGQGGRAGEGSETDRAIASVQYALDHHLYRQSTVERHQVIGTALEHGLSIPPEAIENAFQFVDVIQRKRQVQGATRELVTTRSVLEAERGLIAFAREGRGTRKSLGRQDYQFRREWLNEHQQAAVRHVLESRDTVMVIAGRAGTGKTSLMQEATEAIEQHGREVFTFAPSTGAREVLQEKGFAKAETVEHLIRNTALHEKLKNQVLWIDEAGLLDVRSMNEVFQIAKAQNARVIFSGDTRQHASPRRGEALRLLETEAGLELARTQVVQRQRGAYRQAVELISRGLEIVDARTGKTGLLAGFDHLDAMGKIREIASDDRHAILAKTYLETQVRGKSTLVVAPTHAEAQSATAEIRQQLRAAGKLSRDERAFTQYRSLHLTDAEKSQPRTYADPQGLIVEFHQNVPGGIQKGERYHVIGVQNGQVQLQSARGDKRATLPLTKSERFEVYHQSQLTIAAGDQVRFSLGGTTRDQQSRISNGRLDTVQGFDPRGNLVLQNGWVVDREYAHLDHGYVITSHASQGKDRQVAMAAMGSQSLAAINARQFYVTVSRGAEDVVLFVDDKQAIRRAIQRSGEQLSATEMVASQKTQRAPQVRESRAHQQRWEAFRSQVARWWQQLRGERGVRSDQDRNGREPIDRGPIGRGGVGDQGPSMGRSR